MNEKDSYVVASDAEGERLDTFISLRSDLTRAHVQRLIREGLVTVNSGVEKASHKVRPGDCIEITIPAEPECMLIAEDIPLNVIYEDEHIIAVNKPAGMVIYPAAGNSSGTLMNAIAAHCDKLASIGAPLRAGVVHRLDKDTSGVIVTAKDDTSYYELSEQFKNREVEKDYLALVYGNVKNDKGEIHTLIGRSASNRKKMSARVDSGKEAVTFYEIIERFNGATLVRVRIVTGRTHQIRVHFASRGYPVLGDMTYGRKTSIRIGKESISFPRQMLHAYSLRLHHPIDGRLFELTAQVPDDMQGVIDKLTQSSS